MPVGCSSCGMVAPRTTVMFDSITTRTSIIIKSIIMTKTSSTLVSSTTRIMITTLTMTTMTITRITTTKTSITLVMMTITPSIIRTTMTTTTTVATVITTKISIIPEVTRATRFLGIPSPITSRLTGTRSPRRTTGILRITLLNGNRILTPILCLTTTTHPIMGSDSAPGFLFSDLVTSQHSLFVTAITSNIHFSDLHS